MTCYVSLFYSIGKTLFPLILSSHLSNKQKRTGTKKSSAIVPTTIPPKTPDPMDKSPLAPAPDENINGNIPKIITVAVITIGRKRILTA